MRSSERCSSPAHRSVSQQFRRARWAPSGPRGSSLLLWHTGRGCPLPRAGPGVPTAPDRRGSPCVVCGTAPKEVILPWTPGNLARVCLPVGTSPGTPSSRTQRSRPRRSPALARTLLSQLIRISKGSPAAPPGAFTVRKERGLSDPRSHRGWRGFCQSGRLPATLHSARFGWGPPARTRSVPGPQSRSLEVSPRLTQALRERL